MPIVTVTGAGGQTVTLTYDSSANASIASKLAAQITEAVHGGAPVGTDSVGGAPALPAGVVGEFVKQQDGVSIVPARYDAVVDAAATAIVYANGDLGESVLAGAGNLTFVALSGSGTVAAGGGNDLAAVSGSWQIDLGDGKDTVFAIGAGADTISVGSGSGLVDLGAGASQVSVGGAYTINAGSGAATVTAASGASVFVKAGGNLDFVGGNGGNTVLAGTGSETLFAGGGSDVLHGGAAGRNLLAGGAGGDTLYGSTGETGTDVFQFAASVGGGTDLVSGFVGADKISLLGYGAGAVSNAVATQQNVGGATIITLSDSTKITFLNVADLTKNNFA